MSVAELWVCQRQDGGVTLHMVDPQLPANLGQVTGTGVVRQRATLLLSCCLFHQLLPVSLIFYFPANIRLLRLFSLSERVPSTWRSSLTFSFSLSGLLLRHMPELSHNQSFYFPFSSL